MQSSQARILILVLIVGLTSFHALGQQGVRELSPKYRKWLDEDVIWVITPSERKEFKGLASDEQRDQFVAAFWERRNPTPGSRKNPFKEEHYRRITYANEHFAAQAKGWRTDRGRIYILYGPPDSIAKEPRVGEKFAQEVWTYVHMPGGGDNVSLRFVDECVCGFYELVSKLPNDKGPN